MPAFREIRIVGSRRVSVRPAIGAPHYRPTSYGARLPAKRLRQTGRLKRSRRLQNDQALVDAAPDLPIVRSDPKRLSSQQSDRATQRHAGTVRAAGPGREPFPNLIRPALRILGKIVDPFARFLEFEPEPPGNFLPQPFGSQKIAGEEQRYRRPNPPRTATVSCPAPPAALEVPSISHRPLFH